MIRIVLLTVVVLAVPVRADDNAAAARDHFQRGSKAFDLGVYDEAITEYNLAYRLRDEPALLYNLAQAHRLAGHAADALRFYKIYLTKVPNAANRRECETKIAELQKLVDQQKRTQQSLPPDQAIKSPGAPGEPAHAEPAPVAPGGPAEKGLPPSALAEHPVAVSPHEQPTVAIEKRGGTKIIAGAVVAAVGLGALATGIAFGVLARNASDDLTKADRAGAQFDGAKYDAGKTDQILEGVFLGVGAAAAVTGAVVLALGARERRVTSHASLIPSLSPSSAALSLRVKF
jgi:tetratricopeptide (TPR) repeat protein